MSTQRAKGYFLAQKLSMSRYYDPAIFFKSFVHKCLPTSLTLFKQFVDFCGRFRVPLMQYSKIRYILLELFKEWILMVTMDILFVLVCSSRCKVDNPAVRDEGANLDLVSRKMKRVLLGWWHLVIPLASTNFHSRYIPSVIFYSWPSPFPLLFRNSILHFLEINLLLIIC